MLQAWTFNVVGSVVFALSAKYLASASSGNAILLWYAEGKSTKVEQQPLVQLVKGSPAIVIAVNPDGCIAAGHLRGTVSLWDMETKKLVKERTGSEHSRSAYSLMFSPHDGGKMLLSSSADGTAEVCEVATGKLLHRFTGSP